MKLLPLQVVSKFLCSFVLVLLGFHSQGQDVLQLKNNHDEYFLTPHIEVLEDTAGKLTIGDITSSKYSDQFKKPEREIPINQNLKSAYWIKFNLQDLSRREIEWVLECYDSKVDKISFYYQDTNGVYVERMMGDVYPFSQKIIRHKNFGFLIPFRNNQPQTFYVRAESEQFVAFYFVVKTVPHYINYALEEYYFLGFFYGIIVLVGLLNLFLFFNVRDTAYLYYVFYIINIGLLFMSQDGIGYQFLWFKHPEYNKYASAFTSLFMVTSALLYARSFLKPSMKKRLLDVCIYSALALKVIIFIYRFYYSPYDLWDPFLDWQILLVPLTLGVVAIFRGYKPAYYYVAAFVCVSIGFLTYSLMFKGVIPANLFTVYSLNYSEIAEVILLSVALADRVRTFKEEKEREHEERLKELEIKEKLQAEVITQLKINEELKDKVNRELEEKVKERTVELSVANQQLQLYTEEIKRMNQLLQIDNSNLQDNIKKQAKDRVMLKPLTFEEFKNIYPDDDACYRYLDELKWGNGYLCLKCKGKNYSKGKYEYSKRCTRCRYDESVTAHTIFYNQKFSILKAFYMIFLILERREITEEELATMVDMRRQTCGDFKRKVLAILQGKKKIKNNKEGWGDLVLLPRN